MPFLVGADCEYEKAGYRLEAKDVWWDVSNNKEQYYDNQFSETHKKDCISFDRLAQMKPSMKLAVKLKLRRLNVACEALIVFTKPRIDYKIEHIKIC